MSRGNTISVRGVLSAGLLVAVVVLAAGRPAHAQTPTEQITGDLPAGGGYALVLWSGGTPEALLAAAASRGCAAGVAWVTAGGAFVGYVRGAPAFVNQAFLALYPGGVMPATSVLLVCGAPPASTSAGASARTIGSCQLFPDDNPWATDISNAPTHPLSDRYIASILASGNRFLHADFGSDPSYGIPYLVVPSTQPAFPVTFDYTDESDPGLYPVPPDVPIEAGSDRHVLVVREGECRLYELFDARLDGGDWHAGSGAIFNLRSNTLRPDGWTSADAAGLPILPGLVRLDEVRAGHIEHALRFTVSRTQRAFIHPATHWASTSTDPTLPPMGLRLRLKQDFDLTPFHGDALVVLTALRRYGMFVADNGSNWYISGVTSAGWNDADLDQLKTVMGSAFEAVETGPIVTRLGSP